jgi:Methane oxygenase PmoA
MRFLAILAACILPTIATAADLSIVENKGVLEFHDGDKLITKFDYGNYTRPIFYPVLSPSGRPLTRNWPMVKDVKGEATDHPHQKSAWFTHGDIVAEGIEVKHPGKGIKGFDFWSDSPIAGKIVCTKVDIKSRTKDHLEVVTHNDWVDPDGKKILEETRTVHVYAVQGAWLIVVDTDLFASVASLVFEDTKEGSFGVRVNESIKGKAGTITNAEGLVGEKACWGKPSAWCDYSGTIDGKTAGIAILCDPKNPYPSSMHVREYGLMAANPFGRGKSGFPAMKGRDDLVHLAKDGHLRLRYGLYLHDGDAAAGHVTEAYRDFVDRRESK